MLSSQLSSTPLPPIPGRVCSTGGGSTKRTRPANEAQRPRTDWQKKDENTWLKVVPPWWCEQRTVHFASKQHEGVGGGCEGEGEGVRKACMVQGKCRHKAGQLLAHLSHCAHMATLASTSILTRPACSQGVQGALSQRRLGGAC